MAYPGDANYGKCDDCGGSAYAMGPGREQYCRACHSDRVSYLARNAWARANVFEYMGDWHKWLHTYTPEQLKDWVAKAPERARKRAIIQANLDAYARGEFPGDESLMKGVEW